MNLRAFYTGPCPLG